MRNKIIGKIIYFYNQCSSLFQFIWPAFLYELILIKAHITLSLSCLLVKLTCRGLQNTYTMYNQNKICKNTSCISPETWNLTKLFFFTERPRKKFLSAAMNYLGSYSTFPYGKFYFSLSFPLQKKLPISSP